jgi:hypothetical protein
MVKLTRKFKIIIIIIITVFFIDKAHLMYNAHPKR